MKKTEKALVEQMKISDMEISYRMELLEIKPEDMKLLTDQKILMEEHVDEIVNKFYRKQTSIEEISILIGDADSLRRLHIAQKKYILDLFSGIYDTEYINNRLRIGMVHKRIGVKPKLYLSAVRLLRELIEDVLIKNISNEDRLKKTIDILDKLFYFDITLIVDTYIETLLKEIESAKRKTEIYAESLEEKVKERTKQLEEQSKLDPLTGLYNQKAMYEMLKRELALAKRRKTKIAIVYFDVDKFKGINDKFGHIKGDEVLRSLGRLMIEHTRETDIPCRYGGDEFLLILPDCDTENAKKVCEKIVHGFTLKYPSFSLSMGISETDWDLALEPEQIIQEADKKMYIAKQTEGPKICD